MDEQNNNNKVTSENELNSDEGPGGLNPSDRPGKRRPIPSSFKLIVAAMVGMIAAYFLVFYPLPYYIYQPGSAENIRPMVQVTKQNPPDQGTFMLTTVGVMHANALTYAWAELTDKEMQQRKNVLLVGETEEEYNQRQVYSMVSSQSNAILAAYRNLTLPFHFETESIMVMHLVPGMPAANVLRVGDVLLKMDGKVMESAEQLVNFLVGKKAGDTVTITFKRGETVLEKQVALDYLPVEPAESGKAAAARRVGVGISYNFLMSVQPENPENHVAIQAGEIGGPSAGLMFTLEIINQLLPEDISKGHRIAGTGTISEDGTVGPIGGIPYKVIAANREKAEIFFAPKENAADAIKQANKLKTKMKIVTIGTLSEARDYLKQLPEAAATKK
ncbi:MAG: PDZ domain-containing protein [Gorillibacterium sp.]|nr:PDZ domain-containing protein [Gorillibacterium sp.]